MDIGAAARRMKKKVTDTVDTYTKAAKDLADTPRKLEAGQPYGKKGTLARTTNALEAARKKK